MYSNKPQQISDIHPTVPARPNRLLDQLQRHMRDAGYARRAEKTYLHWVTRFIRYHGKQHPATLSASQITEFLSYLANERQCSPATQRIALNALIYLFTRFLNIKIDALDFNGARQNRRLPVVLTHTEVLRVLTQLPDKYRLMVELLYGSGLRLDELLSLGIKDIDFELHTTTVRSGKGDKDRVTLVPASVEQRLKKQIAFARKLHHRDIDDGLGQVYLPYALARKYPSA
jgi:integrase